MFKRKGGMSLLGVIQVVLIVLKCVGILTWGWGAVLVPLWLWIGMDILLALIIMN